MYPAFAAISRDSGRQGRLVNTIGCPPLVRVDGIPEADACRHLHEVAFEVIARERISDVVLVARFANYEPRDALAARLETTIAAYAARGVHVSIITHIPEQPHFDLKRWARDRLWLRLGVGDPAAIVRSQSVSRKEHDDQRAFAEAAYAAFRDDPRVTLIDLTSSYCDADTCPAGTAERPFFIDDNHVSADGALLASRALIGYLSRASSASSKVVLPSR